MTRYSRNTWKKQNLRKHMNAQHPLYGEKACALCESGDYPDDLSLHVSKDKTCADVHLELSLLTPEQDSCVQGQETYREICCPTAIEHEMPVIKTAGAVCVGLFLFYLFTRHVQKRRNVRDEDESYCGDDGSSLQSYEPMEDKAHTMKQPSSSANKKSNGKTKTPTKQRPKTLDADHQTSSSSIKPSMSNRTPRRHNNSKKKKTHKNGFGEDSPKHQKQYSPPQGGHGYAHYQQPPPQGQGYYQQPSPQGQGYYQQPPPQVQGYYPSQEQEYYLPESGGYAPQAGGYVHNEYGHAQQPVQHYANQQEYHLTAGNYPRHQPRPQQEYIDLDEDTILSNTVAGYATVTDETVNAVVAEVHL